MFVAGILGALTSHVWDPNSLIGTDPSLNKIDEANFIEPFFLGRGLASGDFNNDGWIDFVVTETGVWIFFKTLMVNTLRKLTWIFPS